MLGIIGIHTHVKAAKYPVGKGIPRTIYSSVNFERKPNPVMYSIPGQYDTPHRTSETLTTLAWMAVIRVNLLFRVMKNKRTIREWQTNARVTVSHLPNGYSTDSALIPKLFSSAVIPIYHRLHIYVWPTTVVWPGPKYPCLPTSSWQPAEPSPPWQPICLPSYTNRTIRTRSITNTNSRHHAQDRIRK